MSDSQLEVPPEPAIDPPAVKRCEWCRKEASTLRKTPIKGVGERMLCLGCEAKYGPIQ